MSTRTNVVNASLSRRSFIKGAVLGTAGAASAALLGSSTLSAYAEPALEEEEEEVEEFQPADHQTQQYPATIIDRMGREVVVDKADSIVTLCATGFERLLLLGETSRIVGNFGSLTDWAIYCNGGDVESLGGGGVAADPDVETLNALGTDVLYCWQEAIEAGSVTDPNQADFAAICAQLSTGNPTTLDEFREYLISEIYLYSDALASDEATARANRWVDYVNEKLNYVIEKTATLSEDELIRVYCARGGSNGDPLNGFLKYSYPDFSIQMAGGINVADEAETESYGDVTAEQIAVWNPEVIFCGRMDSTDAIYDSDVFSGTDAVMNGEVYLNPSGVMEWDTGSECVLNTLYIASILHPELFEDLDMVQEVQQYYADFYDTEITEEQAEAILNRKGPEE